jgi:UDP-glucuronate 4-epimerase
MTILVTGAAGFIGSHLAKKLVRQGQTVVGLDNFNDYYDPAQKRANVQELLANAHFKLIEADIRDRAAMFRLFQDEQFDGVAHLAAMAGVRNAIADPALYIQVDLNGTQNLMDAALDAGGVSNFVCASTSSVYGNTRHIPFTETDPCDRPLQPYAAAKRAAEMLGFTYHHLYGLNFTAVRFFTVYGPGGRPDMMPFLIAESIAKGKEILLYNGGEGLYRDWTYVDDITDGLVAALARPLGYEILNLGRGEPVAVNEFISIFEELAGAKARLVNAPLPSSDIPYTYANIEKAHRLLGYTPTVSVREGVRAFWDWYRLRHLQQESAISRG